ncbi:DUF1835 domain-containing protein [Zestomonas carbonaria]|uniref:DUF1835 domain-containing protein n=1 Tax=Zestomonas carbonaria TaxID=2762745 RepID=A0A7U7EMA9_9GAMM|nr:DUF1835 domain-containing protein [Pseudomonas carbonaria]CAD5107658.1 hypothetical protein PSEWESI4_01932 [Pseudomonas carbonaria]
MSDHTRFASACTDGRINLEQQRKRAKELLRRLKADAPDAWQAMRAHGVAARPDDVRLADAQCLIARQLGFASWPRLKTHIDAIDFAARHPGFVADDEAGTLHLRCGNDISHSLRLAGFQGEFQTFIDPLAMGPVPDLPLDDFLAVRADFIARSFDLERARVLADERREYALIERLHEYPRVVLWCEADAYDQLFLVRILAGLRRPPARLELIGIDRVPGVERFIGIGQLAPDLLAWLWPQRRALGEDALDLARCAWAAYSSADPRAWAALAHAPTPALPLLGPALRRQLRELPGLRDGLSLTERLSLRIVAELGEPTFGLVFAHLMQHHEPLPWLGDLMLHALLRPLIDAPTPLLIEQQPQLPWAKRPLSLTDLGRQVLAGERHWLDCQAPERWVGGVCLRAGQPSWCVDDALQPTLR